MDRTARIRDYNNTPGPMGVCCVRNTVNGKVFIGARVDPPRYLGGRTSSPTTMLA